MSNQKPRGHDQLCSCSSSSVRVPAVNPAGHPVSAKREEGVSESEREMRRGGQTAKVVSVFVFNDMHARNLTWLSWKQKKGEKVKINNKISGKKKKDCKK